MAEVCRSQLADSCASFHRSVRDREALALELFDLMADLKNAVASTELIEEE